MTRAHAVRGLLERLCACVRGALEPPFEDGAPRAIDRLSPMGAWDAERVARLERAGLVRPARRPGR